MNIKTLPIIAVAAAFALAALLVGGGQIFLPPTALAQSPPNTPSSVSITRSDGSLTASWDAVSGATSYHITYSSNGGTSWSLASYDHPNDSITISNADNSKTYIVGVRARNEHGGSGWRNSAPAGPYTPSPPATPSSVTVTRADGALTASWNAVPGATSYHITYTSNNGASWSLAAYDHPNSSITITGVTNSATYIVGVRARNEHGDSSWRNSAPASPYTPEPTPTPTPTATATPTPTPTATATPTDTQACIKQDGSVHNLCIISAQPGDGSITFDWTWSRPSDFDETAEGFVHFGFERFDSQSEQWELYYLQVTDENQRNYTVQGLSNGAPYTVRMVASYYRSSSETPYELISGNTFVVTPVGPPPTPPQLPAAPTGLTARAGNGSVILSWNDPADDSITRYQYNVNHNDTSTGKFTGWSSWQSIAGSDADAVSHIFTGLTNGKEYRYHLRAVNAQGAGGGAPSSHPWYVTATPDESAPGSRDPDKDFNTLNAAGNAWPTGIWSDGTTMWVADGITVKIYAYKMSDKTRDPDKDFNTLVAASNTYPTGLWSDGTTMWVADGGDDKIYAYKMSDKTRDPDKDFNTLSSDGISLKGIWSDSTTMWVVDRLDDNLYAYKMSDKQRDNSKYLNPKKNKYALGLWSDGTTMWVSDDWLDEIYAYKMSDGAHDSSKNFLDSENKNAWGMWSDGATMWVADLTDGKIYAYIAYPTQQ